MIRHTLMFGLLLSFTLQAAAVDTQQVPVLKRGGWTVFEFSSEMRPAFAGRREPFVDAEGGVWWCSDRKVMRYDGTEWMGYTAAEGLLDGLVLSVAQDHDGAMWFLGSHQRKAAAVRFDGHAWRLYGEADSLKGKWMGAASCVDSRGHLWAISEHFREGWHNTGGYGVFRFDGAEWRRFTTEDGLAHDRVYDVAAGSDGRVWFTTRTGLSVFDGEGWETYTRADGMRSRKAYRVCVAKDGSVWCTHGDRGGISVLKGDTWTHYSANTGMPVGYVRAVFQDRDGAMWFGTSSEDYRRHRVIGLLRFKDGAWLRITPEDDLPGYNVEGIAQTPDGALWLHVTGTGLVRYAPDYEALGTIEGVVKPRIITPEKRIVAQVQDGSGGIRASTVALPDGRYRVPVFSGRYRVVALNALGIDSVGVIVTAGETIQAGVLSPYWVVPSAVMNLFSLSGLIFLMSFLIAWKLVRKTSRRRIKT